MPRKDSRNLLLGVSWSTGVGVVIALLALIAAGGAIPRWAVIALGIIGFLSFAIAVSLHGWLRAPYGMGTPIRTVIILGAVSSGMFFLCWAVWPPIRRHALDQAERDKFEMPLKKQTMDRYVVQLDCPSADEPACIYGAQFITIFKEVGWKIDGNEVKRVTLGIPYEGIRLFSYVKEYPDPDAPPNIGEWTLTSSSLVTVYRSFSSIGIEPEAGIRKDEPENLLTVYFGSERADESKPTGLTESIEKMKIGAKDFPKVMEKYPNL